MGGPGSGRKKGSGSGKDKLRIQAVKRQTSKSLKAFVNKPTKNVNSTEMNERMKRYKASLKANRKS